MRLHRHPRRAVAALAVVGVVSGVAVSAAAAPTPHPAATVASATTSAQAPGAQAPTPKAPAATDRLTTVAHHQYAAEVHGGATLGALHRVGRDPTLLRTLQSGNVSAARAYVHRMFPAVWYHWHVSRMRILQGGRVVVETGVPFTVAPSQMTLRSAGGRTLGTLQVSIQDEIGFVRFMHRNYGVDVVVRGRTAGHVETSLPAAANARLPATGSVTIAGQRYRVHSFPQTAWDNEPVTVWILEKG
jgi:hypothetical protein